MAQPMQPPAEEEGMVGDEEPPDAAAEEGAADGEGTPWLREADASLCEEDVERHADQAGHNERMRGLLKQRRSRLDAEGLAEQPPQDFEDFIAVSAIPGEPKPVEDENQPPWFKSRSLIENVCLRLHEELLDFVQFMKFTPQEVKARRDWVRQIASVSRSLWPDCQVRIFGSFYTGLSLPNGDVDVAVFNVPCRAGTAMKILADTMLANGDVSWLEIIESAKIPVMKIRSQSCGLRADIVINTPDGLDTSMFIRQCLKDFPQMRPLLVFIKYFLLQRGLNDTFTGGMGSYLLTNVVLHFLQRHPCMRDPRLFATTSLGHLLFDFLRYFGREFRYDVGISVKDGGYTFRKEDRFSSKGKGKSKGGIALCLESPLGDTPVDLGGPCFRMSVLRNLFHHGFHCLCHLLVARAPGEDGSLLCPFLLDPAHGVITSRWKLLCEQPMALAGLRRKRREREEAEEAAPVVKRTRYMDA